jgi:hypothetical protein
MKRFILFFYTLLFLLSSCIKDRLNPVKNNPNLNNEKKLLIKNTTFVDVEYSRKTDILVIVSSNPNMMLLFNYKISKIDTILLNSIPNCVSISQDGNFALVGNTYSITQIDLLNKKIIKTLDSDIEISDIIYGVNNDCFYSQKIMNFDYTTDYIRSMKLDIGNEILSNKDIFGRITMKLHPSGKFFYANDIRYDEPSIIRKFDIKVSKARLLTYSNTIDNNFWISLDGSKIFDYKFNSYTSSYTDSLDIKFIDNLYQFDENNYILSLDEDSLNNKIYFTQYEYSNVNKANFVFELDVVSKKITNKYSLEGFMVSNGQQDQFYEAVGEFVFLSSDNSKLIILTEPDWHSGIPFNMGIEVISLK